jgi:hypothetical protein
MIIRVYVDDAGTPVAELAGSSGRLILLSQKVAADLS